MSSSTLHPPQVELVLRVLTKLLATSAGKTILGQAGPYLDAAAQADSASLRSLAAEQYGQALAMMQQQQQQQHQTPPGAMEIEIDAASSSGVEPHTGTLVKLIALLGDSDPSVAAIASSHLSTHFGSSSSISCNGVSSSSSSSSCNGVSSSSSQPHHLSASLHTALTPGSDSFAALQSVARARESVVRLRVVELLLGSAGRAGAAGADRLQRSGLLQPLLWELDNTADVLSCLSALNVVQQLVEGAAAPIDQDPRRLTRSGGAAAAPQPSSLATVLASLVMPQLLRLLQSSQAALRAGALPIATALLRATLQGGGCRGDPDGDAVMADAGDGGSSSSSSSSSSSAATARSLLDGMRGVLDDSGDGGAEVEAAVLDAVGQLGLLRAGAELVLTDPDLAAAMLERALGRAGSPDVRVAALHATASCAGLDRANNSRTTAAAILSPQAEALLRTSLYAAAGRRTPAEVILPLLQQPFVALRCATYRLTSSLCLRAWFAAEVARSESLMTHLLRNGETGAEGAHWRHACILALQSTTHREAAAERLWGGGSLREEDVQYDAALAAVAEVVAAAAAGGPFARGEQEGGRSGGNEPQPVVATMQS
ncbi:MAG: hypothetical protein WDW36_008867 [Sanguina aurantia]